ncbi:hypothetical protein BdWA1_002240 [Babesia duncani]|uniref:Uncharacterized protein n=1 Tax=Babesia duncani TaxID=323732 RepID=A0AAD9UPN7_9APIC|nr:hypothetical protein BdWA1_002240 [Babesia duncani]
MPNPGFQPQLPPSDTHLGFIGGPRFPEKYRNWPTSARLYSGSSTPQGDLDSMEWLEGLPLELFNLQPGGIPNERDQLIQLCDEAQKHFDAHGSMNEVFKKMNIDPGPQFTNHMLTSMARAMLNKPAPPNEFIKGMLYETGIQSWIANFTNPAPPRNNPYPFGIEPIGLEGQEAIPLSETALLGFLGHAYYDHLKHMALVNPKRAQKISSVIHKIYKRPVLSTDVDPDAYASDIAVLNDVKTIYKAQSETFINFIKQYPNLKFPTTDEEMLHLYSLWYNEPQEDPGDLVALLKDAFGPGREFKGVDSFAKFIAAPAIGTLAGTILGYPLSQLAKKICIAFGGNRGFLFGSRYCNKLNCSLVAGIGAWLCYCPQRVNIDVFQHLLFGLWSSQEKVNPEPLAATVQALQDAVSKGYISMSALSEGLEDFVIVATLKAFRRILNLGDNLGLQQWNLLANQVSTIAQTLLPAAGVSVYRIIYRVACELAATDDLPRTEGGEVLGTDITGLPEFQDDDYSQLYKEGDEMAGLPSTDVARNKHVALLLTTFVCQALGQVQAPATSSEFANIEPDREIDANKVGFNRAEVALVKSIPQMPSTLDDIEHWAGNLDQGHLKRILLKRTFGLDTMDDFEGETPEERHHRTQIELQERRDAIAKSTQNPCYILEILDSLSMTLYAPQDWLLDQYAIFKPAQIAKMALVDLQTQTSQTAALQETNSSEPALQQIKWDTLMLLGKSLEGDLTSILDELSKMGRKLKASDQSVIEIFKVLTFPKLVEELRQLDLTTVTLEQLAQIKSLYRSSDVVFVNALCEVVKKFASETKRELVHANKMSNLFQIEKHISALLTARTRVVNAIVEMLPQRFWYRIDRAFRHNVAYAPKNFTIEEMLGKGPNLERVGQDWELLDPPLPIPDMEASRIQGEKDIHFDKPIPIYGTDTTTPLVERMRLQEQIEQGKIDEIFGRIPTEFHFGEDEENKDIDEQPDLVDPLESKRAIIDSQNAYSAWVTFCYRRRQVNDHDLTSIRAIFPFLQNLLPGSHNHWRRLYVRQRLAQQGSTKPNWTSELDCDEATAREICGIAYEEELLKNTGAVVDHIQDDIGDVKCPYFNPFDPSIYNRLNYLYSHKLPGLDFTEKIEKMQKFLDLTPIQIETINSKCLWYAMDLYIAQVAKEHSEKPWPILLEEFIYPKAKQLNLSQETLKCLCKKGLHDHLKFQALKLMDEPKITMEYMERCHEAIDFFKFHKVQPSNKMPFTIKAETLGMQDEIIESYILSAAQYNKRVDLDKLDELCCIFGLFGPERKETLQKLGRKFYYRYLGDHFDYANLQSLDQIKHLHRVYGFKTRDLEEIIRIYREVKILQGYAPDAGLQGIVDLCRIIDVEPLSKYNYFEHERRAHWLVNILQDVVKPNVGVIYSPGPNAEQQTLKLGLGQFLNWDPKSLQNPATKYEFNTLEDILKTTCTVLEIDSNLYQEACTDFGFENVPKIIEQMLDAILLEDNAKAAACQGTLVKALALVPKSEIAKIKQQCPTIPSAQVKALYELFENANISSKEEYTKGVEILKQIFN